MDKSKGEKITKSKKGGANQPGCDARNQTQATPLTQEIAYHSTIRLLVIYGSAHYLRTILVALFERKQVH